MQQPTWIIVTVVVLAAGALGACGPLGQSEPTPVTLDPTPRLPTLEVEMPLTPDPTPVVTTPTPDPNAMPPTEEDEAEPVTVTPPAGDEAPVTPEAETTPEGEASPQADEATQTEGPADDEELIGQGEEIFVANCAACHQANGQGTAEYPALDGNEFVTAEDPAPVIETVLHGRGEMPAFQDVLSDQQIAAAVSYIRNAWSNEASVVSPEQVQDIREGG